MGITIGFNFNINIRSSHCGSRAGWGAAYIEINPLLGWNFFTRIRYWDSEMKDLLPPVTKFRLYTVEYYNEIQERHWNFLEKKEEFYPKYEGKPQKEGGPNTRLILVIYRLPWLTITNSYHTKLDEQRHKEFLKELDKSTK
jgi:hypothetical protein